MSSKYLELNGAKVNREEELNAPPPYSAVAPVDNPTPQKQNFFQRLFSKKLAIENCIKDSSNTIRVLGSIAAHKLWELPDVVLHEILRHISFPDYIHLMYTCKAAFTVFDTKEMYKVVWDANFEDTGRANMWSCTQTHMEHNSWRDMRYRIQEVHTHIHSCKDKLFGKSYGYSLSFVLQSEMDNAIKGIVENKLYYFPLFYLSNDYWDKFCRAVEERQPHDMYMMCLTKYLTHMQHVHHAYKYLKESRRVKMDSGDIVKFMYELSRLDFGFGDLAMMRLRVFAEVEKHQLDGILVHSNTINFASEKAFNEFILSVSNSLLSLLPKCQKRNGGRNILREFTHPSGRTKIFRFALLLDYLNLYVFQKYSIKIDSRLQSKWNCEIGEKCFVVGMSCFTISSDQSKAHCCENNAQHKPLTFQRVLQICRMLPDTKFAVDETIDPPQSESREYWSHRFDLALDFLSHYVGNVLRSLAQVENFWEANFNRIQASNSVSSSKEFGQPRRGVVHYNGTSLCIYLGRKFGDTEDKVYCHYDRQMAGAIGCSSSMSVNSPATVRWLMKMTGFNYMGISGAPYIYYEQGEYMFTNDHKEFQKRQKLEQRKEESAMGRWLKKIW